MYYECFVLRTTNIVYEVFTTGMYLHFFIFLTNTSVFTFTIGYIFFFPWSVRLSRSWFGRQDMRHRTSDVSQLGIPLSPVTASIPSVIVRMRLTHVFFVTRIYVVLVPLTTSNIYCRRARYTRRTIQHVIISVHTAVQVAFTRTEYNNRQRSAFTAVLYYLYSSKA